MTKSALILALDDAKTELHVMALDNGHDLHSWVSDETYAAHCVCRCCGGQMVVRVYSDHVWKKPLSGRCPKAVAA